MNEQRIQDVIAIEKGAEQLLAAAEKEAQSLPVAAEEEVQRLVADARSSAEQEARKLLEQAQSDVEVQQILADGAQKGKQLESRSKANFDHAVAFVLDRVIGRQ